MLKKLVITFSEPFCTCKKQKFMFFLVFSSKDKTNINPSGFTFHFECIECNIKIKVPFESLSKIDCFNINFDKPLIKKQTITFIPESNKK